MKLIIEEETRDGPKSLNYLRERSKFYTTNGRKISWDTLRKYSEQWSEDIIVQEGRGRKGFEIISSKNLGNMKESREKALMAFKSFLQKHSPYYDQNKSFIENVDSFMFHVVAVKYQDSRIWRLSLVA